MSEEKKQVQEFPSRVEYTVTKSADGRVVTEDLEKEFVFFPITLTKTTTYGEDGCIASVRLYSLGVEAEKTYKEGKTIYTGAFYPFDGVKQLDFEEDEAQGAFKSLEKRYLSLLKDKMAFEKSKNAQGKQENASARPKIIVRGSRLYAPPTRQNEG